MMRITKLDSSQFSLYLFVFHLCFSGIAKYLEYIDVLPEYLHLSTFLFTIPFLFFFLNFFKNLLFVKIPVEVLIRNILFLLMILNMLAVTVLHFDQSMDGIYSTRFNLSIVFWYLVAYSLSYSIDWNALINSRKLLIAVLMIMTATILMNYNPAEGRIRVNYDQMGILMFLGDAFALWSILCICVFRKPRSKLIIAVITIACLYLISSRSPLYAFIIVLFVYFTMQRNWKIILSITAVLGLTFITIHLLYPSMMEERMLQFIYSGSDKSFGIRIMLMKRDFGHLINHWFLGDYNGQLRYGVFGYYLHNYLSLWRQFGLFPFLVFLYLLFPVIFKAVRGKLLNKSRIHEVLFYLALFSLLEIFITRSYRYHFIWIIIGLMTSLIKKENEEGKKRLIDE